MTEEERALLAFCAVNCIALHMPEADLDNEKLSDHLAALMLRAGIDTSYLEVVKQSVEAPAQ